jgi:hypothetical protein
MSYSKNFYLFVASQLFCIMLVMHASWQCIRHIKNQQLALLLIIIFFGVQMNVMKRGLISFRKDDYLNSWLFSVLTPFGIALIIYWAAWYAAHVTGQEFQLVLF